MKTEKRELWDRLNNESERAHRAFQTFLNLPSNDRTVIEAYRSHVGNPEAAKPSDTWARWSRDFAWSERASAYDAYLESLRREAYEQVIKEQAAQQAREVEKARGRYHELMTLAFERAAEVLENAQPADLRAQDVIQIIKLHQEDIKIFGPTDKPDDEDDWTEEDNARFDEIIKEVDALADLELPDLGLEDRAGSEEGSGEDRSEESEDGHN
jgi:hypothetical protein